jgi:hypothetical protein
VSRMTGTDKRSQRFRELQELGCVACRKLGYVSQPDIHHLLSGGKRIGDNATIPLCPFTIGGYGMTALPPCNLPKPFSAHRSHLSLRDSAKYSAQTRNCSNTRMTTLPADAFITTRIELI